VKNPQSSLGAVKLIADANVNKLEPHLKTIVDFLLNAACLMHESAMRIQALEVLFSLATLPYHLVHPYRALVLKGLAKVLDDPKRIVRSKAVACREKWAVFN